MHEIYLFYTVIFILGLILGSFLNVIIDRLPFDRSIIFPSSHCPHCKHNLALIDLIPIISFFYLKKHCRYCKTPISWYYPFIEIITGALFVLTAFQIVGTSINPFLAQLGQLSNIIYLLFFISIMIAVFFIDLKYGIIPFKLIIFAFIITTVHYLILNTADYQMILSYLITAALTFLAFFLLFAVSRGRAIGFGDVVFSFLMGYILGYPEIILGIYIAFLTGAFISFILIITHLKKLKGDTIPFGPFLVFATVISLFWGQTIIGEVLKYFHVY